MGLRLDLTDAGALVALVDKNQPQNARCRGHVCRLSLPLITTWPAFTEAMYLVYQIGGWPLQHNVWRYVKKARSSSTPLLWQKQARMRQLMEQYRDTPMDLADASLVATAEVLNLRRIFTLDSDFYVYRINNTGAFEVRLSTARPVAPWPPGSQRCQIPR